MLEKTMDDWMKRKIGLQSHEALNRQALEQYQLNKLKEMLLYTKNNSPFYAKRLKQISSTEINCLADWKKIPFTTADDLRINGLELLCVSQSAISRIVTLETSGTTDKPKRVYYTEEDQELTVDFFHHGMKLMVDETDCVLILLPCQRPGSVGDLLGKGLTRLGAKTIRHGVIEDYGLAAEAARNGQATALVGAPSQVAQLAKNYPDLSIKTVLLSVEFVSPAARQAISDAWHCKIFEHFGMTETGLGGAVFCMQLAGYHPREADLYFEIINPDTGRVIPEGEYGELVFTTLTRQAMPLLRYRTGDISRWIPQPCACGSVLKRLDRVGERSQKKGYL